MLIKEIINLYSGEEYTVRGHLDKNTAIAQFLYDYFNVSCMVPKGENDEYIEIKNVYEGYIGDLSEPRDIPVLIAGVAEMLCKILIMERLKIDELEVYKQKEIKDAEYDLGTCVDSLSFREINTLIEQIGENRFKGLHDKLTEGYTENFYEQQDTKIERALWVFQLMRFRKHREIKWFRYRSIITNPNIKELIEKLAKRASNTFIEIYKEEGSIDFFPRFGNVHELTASGDLRIGNKVFLFCGLPKFEDRDHVTKRNIAILNACELLDQEKKVDEKYIYYLRWNRFVKIN